MERNEGPQTPFEVYCYSCRVSFPAETKRCLHCGDRLGLRGQSAISARLGQAGGQDGGLDDEESAVPTVARRVGTISLWVLVALAAAISRLCTSG